MIRWVEILAIKAAEVKVRPLERRLSPLKRSNDEIR
jgi:hypothetical protein